MLRIALVQMSSTNDLEQNLQKMKRWVAEAAAKKAQLITFPEMAYFIGEEWQPLLPRYSELADQFASWAKEYSIYILPGTLREPVKGANGRYFNTQLLFDPSGTLLAKYRKLFLFKAKLPDREYDESRFCEPGGHVVTSELSIGQFGFAICYDLRFPEMFRALKKRGVEVAILPSAFTVPTGKAHWESLIRARAIENQFYMIAPAQTGAMGDGKQTYGHSLVVSPWGDVVMDFGNDEGMAVGEIPLKAIAEAERKVSAWESRREELFPVA